MLIFPAWLYHVVKHQNHVSHHSKVILQNLWIAEHGKLAMVHSENRVFVSLEIQIGGCKLDSIIRKIHIHICTADFWPMWWTWGGLSNLSRAHCTDRSPHRFNDCTVNITLILQVMWVLICQQPGRCLVKFDILVILLMNNITWSRQTDDVPNYPRAELSQQKLPTSSWPVLAYKTYWNVINLCCPVASAGAICSQSK